MNEIEQFNKSIEVQSNKKFTVFLPKKFNLYDKIAFNNLRLRKKNK